MIACPPLPHRHSAVYSCDGCRRPVGPDDSYRTTSGRVAICPDCWDRWRRGGYGRRGGRA